MSSSNEPRDQSTEKPGAEDFVAAACFYMERLDWRRALRDLELAVADLKERLADG